MAKSTARRQPVTFDAKQNARARTAAASAARTIPCTEFICRKVFELTILGLNREEVCERIDISHSTWDRWLKTQSMFRTAVETARDSDGRVVGGIMRRAEGMTVSEEKAFLDPRTGAVKKIKLLKELPPDPVAAMMLLTNRHPDRWRWRQHVDHTNSDGSFKAFADAMRHEAGRVFEAQFVPVDQRKITYARGNGHSKE